MDRGFTNLQTNCNWPGNDFFYVDNSTALVRFKIGFDDYQIVDFNVVPLNQPSTRSSIFGKMSGR